MKTNWIKSADEALRRAARRAREIAARTNTPVHVLKGGRITELRPAENGLVAREQPAEYRTE